MLSLILLAEKTFVAVPVKSSLPSAIWRAFHPLFPLLVGVVEVNWKRSIFSELADAPGKITQIIGPLLICFE